MVSFHHSQNNFGLAADFLDLQACSDFPVIEFSRELIEAYPDAKVILTLRDVDSWYKYDILLFCWKF